MKSKSIVLAAGTLAFLSGCSAELNKILTDAGTPAVKPSVALTSSPSASPTASSNVPITTPFTPQPSGGVPSVVPSSIAITPPNENGLLLSMNMETAPADYLYNGFSVTSKGITSNPQGKIGQAWRFDGKGSFMKIPLDINPEKYPQLTMLAWARYTGPDSDGPFQVISHDDGGYDRSLGIDSRGKYGRSWSAFVGSQGVLGAQQPIIKDAWVFLATVYDQKAKTVTLYINGIKHSVTNAELGGGHAFLHIGANPSFGEHFTGDIDELKVFGRGLGPEEIQGLAGTSTVLTPTAQEVKFFDNGNILGVLNGSPCAPSVTTEQAYRLTEIMNYHWNDAQGQAPPGKIGLVSSTGETYGPWDVTTSPGQGGVPHAYWYARPTDIVLPKGTYTITDSQPSTWSYNTTSKCSMSWIKGVPQ